MSKHSNVQRQNGKATPGRDPLQAVRGRKDADAVLEKLAEAFSLLGDRSRVRILLALTGGELCVAELAEAAGMSVSSVSHQLRLLRHNRLVRVRREGKRAYYAVDDEHVATLFREGLRHVEGLP